LLLLGGAECVSIFLSVKILLPNNKEDFNGKKNFTSRLYRSDPFRNYDKDPVKNGHQKASSPFVQQTGVNKECDYHQSSENRMSGARPANSFKAGP